MEAATSAAETARRDADQAQGEVAGLREAEGGLESAMRGLVTKVEMLEKEKAAAKRRHEGSKQKIESLQAELHVANTKLDAKRASQYVSEQNEAALWKEYLRNQFLPVSAARVNLKGVPSQQSDAGAAKKLIREHHGEWDFKTKCWWLPAGTNLRLFVNWL